MKMFFTVLLGLLFSATAFAGFQGYNGNKDLKLFEAIKCSSGLSCEKNKEKFVVSLGTEAVTATTSTLTKSQCGSTFLSSAATTLTLPEASTVEGCEFTFIVGDVSNFKIDPADGDTILLLTNAAGDSITADAVGESVKIKAIGDDSWAPVGAAQGTWSDTD